MMDLSALRVRTGRCTLAVALLLVGLIATGASAADELDAHDDGAWAGAEKAPPPSDPDGWRGLAWTGFEYQGETDLDRQGDFDYWMVSAGGVIHRKLSDRIRFGFRSDYRAVGYDFGGISIGANRVDPWETVHVVRLNPMIGIAVAPGWLVLGGPIGEFSGEGQAQFGDALRGGGLVGAAYSRKNLLIGFGVIALSEIEKDVRIRPFVRIDWNITDELAFRSKADTSRGGDIWLEYALFDGMLVGAGVGVRNEVFRLNGDGGGLPAASAGLRRDGVGEESASTAKILVSYEIHDGITLEGYGGVTIDGEFRLEDEDGRRLASSDYDDSGFGGVNLRFGF